MQKTILAALLAAGCATGALISAPAQAQTEQRRFDIAAQPLGDALRKYGDVSGRPIIYAAELVQGRRSKAIRGRMSSDAALTRLLAGTGLSVELVDGTLVLRAGNGDAEEPGSTETSSSDTIIVTGSRIRGAGPVGSPVVSIDRDAIEKSGFATVQQILQSLPQNFGGGSNETTTGATTRNGTGNDATLGSSINLRGLGTSSTLVLIDGSRPALGGVGGLFTDISLIPMSAVERLEVLTDGASAIYGADAVAGVVNVRLRNRFEGAETMLRAGTADGDMTEVQFSQLFGKAWGGGRLVLAYQFSERGSLAAATRDFAREDLRPFGGPDYRSLYGVPARSEPPTIRFSASPPGRMAAASLQPSFSPVCRTGATSGNRATCCRASGCTASMPRAKSSSAIR